MASGGRGAGRGNLLEKMKQKLEEEQRRKQEEELQHAQTVEEPAPAPEPAPVTASSGGRGRGNLLEKMRRSTSLQTSVVSTTASITSTQTTSTSSGRARGSALSESLRKNILETTASSEDTSGLAGKVSSMSINVSSSVMSEPDVVTRQGSAGKVINLTTNYVNIKVIGDKGMYQYEVKFAPDIDSRSLRFKLLNQHLNELGNVKTFDGALLYLPIKLPDERTVFQSVHPVDNSTVTLTIIFKKKQAMKDNITFFNNLINRILRALKLIRIGRHDFNHTLAHTIPQYNLEVWPGYVTAVNEYEDGLKLNLDATHRVMRLDTVRDLMGEIYKKNRENFKKVVTNEIVGTSVLTRYNNRSYKIDDIDWDNNPLFKFLKNNEEISLFDYYKQHYNIIIKDLKQPLLIHRNKEKNRAGETVERICLLIPELCFLSGITDSIRNDHKITKELSQITKISPEHRRDVIRTFIKQVNSNEITRKILSDWGLELENDTVPLSGRVLNPEELEFGNNYKQRVINGDWGKAAVNSKVYRTPNVQNWAIICTHRNKKNCDDFLEAFKAVCNKVNIRIGEPKVVLLNNDNTENYIKELRNIVKLNLNLIVIIFPTMRQDRYSAIKKFCCVENPVPSQVINSRTISRPDKIRSITEKIALQINCKIGGALWALKNPFANCMVCGIDVFHAGAGQSKASVAAFTASLDKMLTTWHSRVCLQGPHQEMVDLLKQCLISAIAAYRKVNGVNPDSIIIYRDGVGDGQLEMVKNFEVKQFLETCTLIEPSYKPKLTVVIVQKRINTRLFEKGNQLSNPPPGTIVDSSVTRRYLYDFYLVPQLVRQGTVTPTHYIVLHDGGGIETDYIQRFTYKLCHLYYNWTGTIRVPAPCQYAHKLAYLVGQSIKMEPHQTLNNLLYYL